MPCPICGETNLHPFYRQEDVPVQSVRLFHDRTEAIRHPTGTVDLALCRGCGFIFNRRFDPETQQFSESYESTQSYSATFRSFHRDLAAELVERYGLEGGSVMEIGCGQGNFLRLLSREGVRRLVGFDPAYRRTGSPPSELHSESVEIVQDYYSRAYTDRDADLYCCKMTLEHVRQPTRLLEAVRASIGARSSPRLFLQVPDAGRVLEDDAFEDVYYEHCNYFTAETLEGLLHQAGFRLQRRWTAYDDQYLLAVARPADEKDTALPRTRIGELTSAANRFAERVDRRIEAWNDRLASEARRNATVVIWGGGSKAVSFLNAVDVDHVVRAVVDVNPNKHGTYLPGTGHPVVDLNVLTGLAPDLVILMNEIYREEVEGDLREHDLDPSIHSLEEGP